MPKVLAVLKRVHLALARQLLNAVILLVLLSTLAWAAFLIKDSFSKSSNPVLAKYGTAIYQLYPSLSRAEVDELLREMWSRWYSYDPFTQFREAAYRGRYVNVHPVGFRESRDQGPWPPLEVNHNVFLFGGSTVFGYGLPDGETIASALQETLNSRGAVAKPVKVYNFASAKFISSQEVARFQSLLRDGFIPDTALFMDGLNDTGSPDGIPEFSREIQLFLERGQGDALPGMIGKWLAEQPLGRALTILTGSAAQEEQRVSPVNYSYVAAIVRRYLENKKQAEALARTYGVKPLFIWQPIPFYRFDRAAGTHYIFNRTVVTMQRYHEESYQRMRQLLDEGALGDDFLWAADLQEGRSDPLYVDVVHYSSGFSQIIAGAIADKLLEDRGK